MRTIIDFLGEPCINVVVSRDKKIEFSPDEVSYLKGSRARIQFEIEPPLANLCLSDRRKIHQALKNFKYDYGFAPLFSAKVTIILPNNARAFLIEYNGQDLPKRLVFRESAYVVIVDEPSQLDEMPEYVRFRHDVMFGCYEEDLKPIVAKWCIDNHKRYIGT